MKTSLFSIAFALALVGCSEQSLERQVQVEIPATELSDITCPVHEVPVLKVSASGVIGCGGWDATHGLSVEQLRQRFPYAIWDSNIYLTDDSPDATMPLYNLVCDRCVASWREYVVAHPPGNVNQRLEVSVTADAKILIDGVEFSVEQLTAVAKLVAAHQPDKRVLVRSARATPREKLKAVVKACADGGLNKVIFGAYMADEPGEVKAIPAN